MSLSFLLGMIAGTILTATAISGRNTYLDWKINFRKDFPSFSDFVRKFGMNLLWSKERIKF